MTSQLTNLAAPSMADYDALAQATLAALPEERRREIAEAKARGGAMPRPDPRACAYLVGLWRGLKPRQAAAAAGLELQGQWHLISEARRDLVYRAAYAAADRSMRDRIAAKAVGVVEAAMDGEEISREAARLAPWILGGSLTGGKGSGSNGGNGGGPSVVINLSPASALQSVATGSGKVITANIIE